MSWRNRLQRLVFRPMDDGDGPITLTRRRIYILPSRAGLLYALTLLVMLLAAINYQLALGHALTFFLAAVGIVGMVHSFRNLHGLRVLCRPATPVFVGETAEFVLQISQSGRDGRYGLVFSCADHSSPPLAVDPGQEGKTTLCLATTRRGYLVLPRIKVHSRYPLGLFTTWSVLFPRRSCLVYPQAIHAPLPAQRPSSEPGRGQRPQGSEDFIGFRPRQASDPLSHIAWKASARGGPEAALLIQQLADGEASRWHFDWQDCPAGSDVEQRIAILTGWVLHAAGQGWRYSLALPGQSIPEDQGEAPRRRCLEALARYPA